MDRKVTLNCCSGVSGFMVLVSIFISDYTLAKESQGEKLYVQNCMVCHGDDGSGAMPGVSDLTEKRAWMDQPESQLLVLLKLGMQTPGAVMAMPPKGGNSELTDDELIAIMRYMRKVFRQ